MSKEKEFYWLNKDSVQVLKRGYLEENVEPRERIREIAGTAEKYLNIKGFSDKFYNYMSKGWYSLSSPVWANFGKERALGISCFGSYTEDSIVGILDTVSESGMMSKMGGGTSTFMGDVRPRGAKVSTGGVSNGSVSFMEILNTTTNTISQNGIRRGSMAVYLPIDHEDIEEFLTIRNDESPIQHLNLGVTVTDKWMSEMEDGDKEKRTIWAKVLKKRSETGFPYIFFTDTVNKNKPEVYKEKDMQIHASNLCMVGTERVVSTKGYLTAKELYDLDEELVLFNGERPVASSKMKLREENVDVYKITLENGLEHTVTKYHGIPVYKDGLTYRVECKELKPGDLIQVQCKKGLFGTKTVLDATNIDDLWETDEESTWNFIKNTTTLSKQENEGVVYKKDVDTLKKYQILLHNLGFRTELKETYLTFSKPIGYDMDNLRYAVKTVEYVGKEDVYCPTIKNEEHIFIANGFKTFNCSEIMLPASKDESFVCCLSSMNLAKYDEWKDTDAVETLLFFLDAVLSEFIEKVNNMPFMEKTLKFTKRHRAIGLGVLGLHSYLQSKSIPFEGLKVKQELNSIFKNIRDKADSASKKAASLYGEPELLKGKGERWTTKMAIAPTTSSSFILGQISPSIEPLMGNYMLKDIAKGKYAWRNPELEKVLEKYGKNTQDVWKKIMMDGGSVQKLKFLTPHERNVFKTFQEISQLEIVQNASIIQRYVDQGISLNLFIPPKTPVKDINMVMMEAWKLGLKSLYYQRGQSATQNLGRSILTCTSCEG